MRDPSNSHICPPSLGEKCVNLRDHETSVYGCHLYRCQKHLYRCGKLWTSVYGRHLYTDVRIQMWSVQMRLDICTDLHGICTDTSVRMSIDICTDIRNGNIRIRISLTSVQILATHLYRYLKISVQTRRHICTDSPYICTDDQHICIQTNAKYAIK